MSAIASGFSTPVETLQAARDDGLLAGRQFLQLLIERGATMDGQDAGHIFGSIAIEEFGQFVKAKNKETGLARMSGFLCFIGEVLWQETEPQRQAVTQIFDAPIPARTPAKVIPIVKLNAPPSPKETGGGDGQ